MSIDPISAKKALESMLKIDELPREDREQESLDREEEREAEYAVMGLKAPPAPPVSTSLLNRLARLLGRGS